jgi:hypothetical protein
VPSGNSCFRDNPVLPVLTSYEKTIQKEKTNEGCYKAPHGFSVHSHTSGVFVPTAGLKDAIFRAGLETAGHSSLPNLIQLR